MNTHSIPQWFIASPHTHRTARAIAIHGPISRTALAQMLDLSQGALSRITGDLIYAKVIEETPWQPDHAYATARDTAGPGNTSRNTSARRGRPQTALRLCAGARTFLGANIHGTDISMVVTDALCRPVNACLTEPLDSSEPRAVARQLCAMARRCIANVTPSPVCMAVSVGGHVDANHIVTYAPFLHWDGRVDLSGMIERDGGLPCAAFNDLDSLLMHESWFGMGVGLSRFAVITIGAGIGYSLAVNGRPVDYPDKSYGLAGHVPLDPEGPRCYAGHIGCSQCLTSDSLAQEYSSLVGRPSTFDQFARAAQEGEPQAKQLVNRMCFRLGTLIATMANFVMPDQVIISGESSFLAHLNTESIRNAIRWYRPSQVGDITFTIVDFDWSQYAEAAAARAIACHIG